MAKSEPDEEMTVDEVVDEDEAEITYDIAAYPSDLTLSVVYEMFQNDDIVIPDYQRNYVWNLKQASLLIESFLLGLPVPQVFFYIDDSNKSLVIDGQQRILSVVFFLEGFFGSETLQGKKQVFRLQLNEKSPFANKRFTDLSDSHQRKFRAAVLRAINIRQLDPKGQPTSVYHIFERLNTGGTPLKPQEIRNCVFRGPIVARLRKLNSNPDWRLILGKKHVDRHQKDLELILRIFSLAYYFDEYEKPMKEFLNEIMERNRKASSKEFETFASRFASTADAIVEAMGDRPFHIRGPLNSSALDAVFATLISAKGEWPDDLGERYELLKKDEGFIETTSHNTSDVAVVKLRFELAAEHLLG
jgi:uncharacterized protein with ParB-like and HNH nuclease domain